MFLKKVEVNKYRKFKNNIIDLEKNEHSSIYSIASINGGGKSTLLQFIFILLHCFSDKIKTIFIKNLLEDQSLENGDLASFEIEDCNENFELKFIIEDYNKNFNFNLFLDLEDTLKSINIESIKNRKYRDMINLSELIENQERVTPEIRIRFKEINSFFVRMKKNYKTILESDNIEDYKNEIRGILEKNDVNLDREKELRTVYKEIEMEMTGLKKELEANQLKYIMHLDDKKVLLLKTNMAEEKLLELSNKVYLNAPSSQIFHFLSKDEKSKIFNNFEKGIVKENKFDLGDIRFGEKTYEEELLEKKKVMSNFFNYEFVASELIVKSFEKAFEEDKQIKLKTGDYGNEYDDLAKELNSFFEDKTISVTPDLKRVIFKFKNSGNELLPQDLSHGELKMLGLYVWMKYIVEKGSIVLMDEVDIALHPKWQHEIVKDLSSWGGKNQIFIATHSPQILSTTYYKNIIVLEDDNSKVKITQRDKPLLDRDINTVIETIMGAKEFPVELMILHKKYRKLIDEGNVEIKNIK